MKSITPFANPTLASLQGRLVNELNISFGQSPAIAHAISETADRIYTEDNSITKPGNILYTTTHVKEPSGKPLNQCNQVSVKLTLWDCKDDLIENKKELRKAVLQRITTEAYDQEGVLTIDDCRKLMLCDERTIKIYISELKKDGIYLPLRGYVHSTGRGQTHKNEIICYYLEGMQFKDIQFKTYHSIEAISRYITMFQRIVICHVNQNMDPHSISTVVNVSQDLVKEYLKIYEEYSSKDNERLELILNPAKFENFIQPLKKKMVLK